MKITRFPVKFPLFCLIVLIASLAIGLPKNFAAAQVPTVTPPPSSGLYITVITDEPFINVRMGPSSSIYPIVGQLVTGSTATALGRSQGGDWIQIEFPGAPNNQGWVYSPLVAVSPPGSLQIVEPPPTPPQPPTATIDPTLAAQFSIDPTNTRLPTFTPAASLTPVGITEAPEKGSSASVPPAVVIIAFVILGLIGLPLSMIRR